MGFRPSLGRIAPTQAIRLRFNQTDPSLPLRFCPRGDDYTGDATSRAKSITRLLIGNQLLISYEVSPTNAFTYYRLPLPTVHRRTYGRKN